MDNKENTEEEIIRLISKVVKLTLRNKLLKKQYLELIKINKFEKIRKKHLILLCKENNISLNNILNMN